jgi:hypothetical protein
MVDLVFRTDDPSRWGTGLGTNLTAAQLDTNFWNIAQAILALQSDRPQPNGISAIDVVDETKIKFTLQDGTVLGPLPLPVLEFRWRGEYGFPTLYTTLDVITVEGKGLFLVLQDHNTTGAFNPDLMIGGNPAYLKMLGVDPPSDLSYDVAFYYPGRLSDVTATYLFQYPALRHLTVDGTGVDHHIAYLQEAPVSVDQVMTIYLDDGAVGTVTVLAGETLGTVVISSDLVDIPVGQRLAVGPPAAADAVAAGLSVGIIAKRVI